MSIFSGENPIRLGWNALGLALTAAVDDALFVPAVAAAAPSLVKNHTAAKVADAATTFFTAWGIGSAVAMVNKQVGRDMRDGGSILAIGRFFSAFLPGFSINAKLPSGIGPFHFGNPPAPPKTTATPQLTPGTSMTSAGVVTDYSAPASASLDVGM